MSLLYLQGPTNIGLQLFRLEERFADCRRCLWDNVARIAILCDHRNTGTEWPSAYYTSDWDSARDSVRRLAALRLRVMAMGHGLLMIRDDAPAHIAAIWPRTTTLDAPQVWAVLATGCGNG